jgi:hypothetical protein
MPPWPRKACGKPCVYRGIATSLNDGDLGRGLGRSDRSRCRRCHDQRRLPRSEFLGEGRQPVWLSFRPEFLEYVVRVLLPAERCEFLLELGKSAHAAGVARS